MFKRTLTTAFLLIAMMMVTAWAGSRDSKLIFEFHVYPNGHGRLLINDTYIPIQDWKIEGDESSGQPGTLTVTLPLSMIRVGAGDVKDRPEDQ